MALIFDKLRKFLNFEENNKREILENQEKPSETVRLSAKRNLLNYSFLSYDPVISHFIPILNETVYIPFERRLSYRDMSEPKTASEIFGVSEISPYGNPEPRYYPLPLYFPEEVAYFDQDRMFKFQTISGNNLFFLLKYQIADNIDYHHFVYCFDTESKSWSRVIAVRPDGTYYKIALESFKHHRDFPTESKNKALKTFPGGLIIWGEDGERLHVGTDDTPENFHYDSVKPGNPDAEKYLEEQYAHNRKYLTECFGGSTVRNDTLRIEKLCDRKFVPLYTVSGIHDFIKSHETFSEGVSISHCGSFPLKYLSRNAIGTYFAYFMPRKWSKGVFMVFNTEG